MLKVSLYKWILMGWCVLLHQCIVLLLAAAQSISRNTRLEGSPWLKWGILHLENYFRDTAHTARKKKGKGVLSVHCSWGAEAQNDEVGGFRNSKTPEVFSGASIERGSLTFTSWNPQNYQTRVTDNWPCVKHLACASICPSVRPSIYSKVCF